MNDLIYREFWRWDKVTEDVNPKVLSTFTFFDKVATRLQSSTLKPFLMSGVSDDEYLIDMRKLDVIPCQ